MMKGAIVKDKESVLCLAKSILYEKTNDGWIHGSPTELEEYLADFAADDTTLIDGPLMATCKGCKGKSHSFLVAEGVYKCDGCEHWLCRFCCMSENEVNEMDGDRLLCFECMRGALSGMTEGEDEAEMRAFLSEKGQKPPVAATYMEVLSLYEKAEAGEFNFFDNGIRTVKFPVLPTSALHASQPIFERLKEVRVKEIETLVVDAMIPMDAVVGHVGILASLTRLKGRDKGEKLSYMHVLPTNIIHMAENCRVHTGERLCKRGLRHALDDGTPDVLDASLTLA
jgi:hypothetical protein